MSKDNVRKSTCSPLYLLESRRVTLSSASRLRKSESRDVRVDEDEVLENLLKNDRFSGLEGVSMLDVEAG